MRRIFHLSMLCLAAGVASACKPAEDVTAPPVPTAGVRFINAVPDTGASFGLDFRFMDIVENSGAFRMTFRNGPQTAGGVVASGLTQFKAAQAGSRKFRIFLDDTLQAVASTVLKDSTATLESGHNYTFLLWGNARSTGTDKMRLTVIDETITDPTTNVALRVINATGSAIDVRQYVATGTVPAAATWANVAPFAVSAFVNTTPAQIRYNVRPAGGAAGTELFTDVLAIIGQPAGTATAGCTVGVDCDAIPGTTVPGSAVTMVVFPRSVAGSKAPQTTSPINFTLPGGSFMWDRRPTRTCTVSFGC